MIEMNGQRIPELDALVDAMEVDDLTASPPAFAFAAPQYVAPDSSIALLLNVHPFDAAGILSTLGFVPSAPANISFNPFQPLLLSPPLGPYSPSFMSTGVRRTNQQVLDQNELLAQRVAQLQGTYSSDLRRLYAAPT